LRVQISLGAGIQRRGGGKLPSDFRLLNGSIRTPIETLGPLLTRIIVIVFAAPLEKYVIGVELAA
jgi:hypothetical protein